MQPEVKTSQHHGFWDLHGWERTTGKGASHSARVLLSDSGDWARLSELSQSVYEGRESGFEHYSLPIGKEEVWAHFYRSNSGRMEVTVYRGHDPDPIVAFGSFQRAEIWGRGRALTDIALSEEQGQAPAHD